MFKMKKKVSEKLFPFPIYNKSIVRPPHFLRGFRIGHPCILEVRGIGYKHVSSILSPFDLFAYVTSV